MLFTLSVQRKLYERSLCFYFVCGIMNTTPEPAKSIYKRKHDYTPVQWNAYYSECENIAVNEDIFHIYKMGVNGPVLVLLHGGGFSALTWAVFSKYLTQIVDCRILAVDLRGHGDTHTVDEDDFSAETLSRDVHEIVVAIFGSEPPPIILIGHSMGGAIAVHVAYRKYIPSLRALVVIDIVEGTALNALTSMKSFLQRRPPYFQSIEKAIEWSVCNGQIRNSESAKVSMPGQLKNIQTGKIATNDLDTTSHLDHDYQCFSTLVPQNSIKEEEEEGINDSPQQVDPCEAAYKSAKYTWRIDLNKTEAYWTGWFQGLSNMFLNCPIPKLLVLAGLDRLDKDLIIGQMQGKFQVEVLSHSGHAVHEDVPDKMAEVIATFLKRFKLAHIK